MIASSLFERSQSLLGSMISKCTSDQGFGSMSASYYDTAWLSMIESPAESGLWLFPQSFDFILKHQSVDGAWKSYASQVDGILNTSACLLSIKVHMRKCSSHQHYQNWVERSLKADAALKQLLQHWNVESTDQVGFEILVVKLLELLAAEGNHYDFPRYDDLRNLCRAKLGRLAPESVYKARSTLYHSLEGLIGHIDFDQVIQWQENDGSMLGSPSSTAAYLMHSSTWDSKAEAYLRSALEHGIGNGNGSVPSAWPSSIFEMTWATTTIVGAGIPISKPLSSTICDFVEKSLSDCEGTVGFTSTVLADADDTARALMTLRYLGRRVDIGPLIQKFESRDYFRTYDGERNPSFSANCNILICLLLLEDPASYACQITKALRFLCTQACDENVNEKWHTHRLYWMLLLAQAFELIYNHVKKGKLEETHFDDTALLSKTVPLVSLQLLTRTMSSQSSDGSWDGVSETTAYGVLLLSSLSRLPWIQQACLVELFACIYRAKSFLLLQKDRWDTGSHLWIEKTTYASNTLAEAYCLAASAISTDMIVDTEWPAIFSPSTNEQRFAALKQSSNVIGYTPLFAQSDQSVLSIAQAHANYSMSDLEQRCSYIFPLSNMNMDKYLAFIPLTWTACNTLRGGAVSQTTIREMVFLSMLNYQVDEYLENITDKILEGDLVNLNSIIDDLCSEATNQLHFNNGDSHKNGMNGQKSATNGSPSKLENDEEDVRIVLGRYISHILHHPQVIKSPVHLQRRLAREIRNFLHAHVRQAHDNIGFNGHMPGRTANGSHYLNGNGTARETNGTGSTERSAAACFDNADQSFFGWLHGTSADHTSCPFSFVFFNCLMAGLAVGQLFTTAKTSYVAESLGRHLAALCRMYNDYGSIARDREEHNLNSVNFPEFHLGSAAPTDKHLLAIPASSSLNDIKADLLSIADYERKGLQMAMEALEQEIGTGRLLGAIKLFIDVTDLYGQVYVLKDYGTRKA